MTIIGRCFAPKLSPSRRLNESERNGRDENGDYGLKRQPMPGGLLGLRAPVIVAILTGRDPAITIAVIADVVAVATGTKEMTTTMRAGTGGMGAMPTEARGKGKFAIGRRGTENIRKMKKVKKIIGLMPNAKAERVMRVFGREGRARIDHGLDPKRGARGTEG